MNSYQILKEIRLQDEMTDIKEAVLGFATEMIVTMEKHAMHGKTGWRDFPDAIERAEEELREYKESGNRAELIDVANFLMMEWIRKEAWE